MELDPGRYPHTARYIKSLPRGFDGYPECLLRTDIREDVREALAHLDEGSGLPPVALDVIHGRYQDTWMPETLAGSVFLLLRDLAFHSDEELARFAYERAVSLFKKPHYRLLMYVMSPSLVVMGATSRWAAFHQGSELTATPVERREGGFETLATLTYPPGLFEKLSLNATACSFKAAVDAAGAKETNVSVIEASASEARFRVRWDR